MSITETAKDLGQGIYTKSEIDAGYATKTLSNTTDLDVLNKVKNVDGDGSGLDADLIKGEALNNLTQWITTSGAIEAGRTSGSVALTVNDGYGNANIAFNHKYGVPDTSGSSARITSSVDGTTGLLAFQVADNTTVGTTVLCKEIMKLTSSGATVLGNTVWHNGNATKSLTTNGYQKLPNGLIIQWGTGTTVGDYSTINLTFPIAFNKILMLNTSIKSQTSTHHTCVNSYSNANASVRAGQYASGAVANEIFNYIAIGY